MVSTSPRPMMPASSSQSKRSAASAAASSDHKSGSPIRRSGTAICRSPCTGTQSTRFNLRRTREESHSTSPISVSGMVHTKVDSSARPRASTGSVFSSMPSASKSGAAREPAVAPKARSINAPTKPLWRRKSAGAVSENRAATSAIVAPESARARARSSASVSGATPAVLHGRPGVASHEQRDVVVLLGQELLHGAEQAIPDFRDGSAARGFELRTQPFDAVLFAGSVGCLDDAVGEQEQHVAVFEARVLILGDVRNVLRCAYPGTERLDAFAPTSRCTQDHEIFMGAREHQLTACKVVDQRQSRVLVLAQAIAYVFVEHRVDHVDHLARRRGKVLAAERSNDALKHHHHQ